MTLKAIFNKPVDRAIEGVIKADDETSLRLEVEEYVLTNEIAKRLEAFLDAYNNYAGANGVWISGFFGSGKSHLLKMLALLLENRQIDEKSSLDLFLPKCGDNEILRGDLRRATSIPSHSILFNIDQKADVISKNQIDALLAVFVKVFDEMCGYYGKQGYIAQFERDLDSRGQYYEFKSAYESTAGRTWQKGREQALLEAKNIAKAYAQATDGDEASAMGILDRYRSQYRVSIEDFAEQVHAYIEQQSPDFRLNFFVDEVGQYIAENVKLMTNLQTIAESLATKCRGRAWIIVTAQADMELVVGEMSKQQGNDFSKIQDRFANRIKLTSANVEEVIQKRLLTKNSEGFSLISKIYDEQSNNFRTLFDFSDGARIYKNFGDREHFIHSYPFIPYQFTLFQSAIQNLSQYNSFEGKHSSVGERSMLGVFQQVAIHIGNHEIGQLATFDLMFEGIRSTLRSNIQQAVIQAERHLNNPFAIRLLKALFLVKHVKEFKSSIHNLCILMQESFDQDLPLLRKQVEEALNLLEQQTYVQRNGELYEYLTDEEKDIEQEIKNTDVEASDVADELEKIVFDHIIKQRKIRYEESGQDYSFTRKLDDRLHGREYELAINIITPFHEHAEDASMMKMQNMGRSELMVLMPADERLMRDLLMYKRTDKYILQNISITQQETVTDLLNGKRSQNQDRYTKLQLRLHNLLGKARLFASGTEVEVSSENAQMRILRGFQELITLAYPNLRMLRGVQYTEDNIKPILLDQGGTLLGNNATALAESEQELLAFIQGNNRSGVRTTLKNLLEKFERKPYGWDYAAVLCNLASLYARGKVEIRVDSNLLEGDALVQALRNSHGHGNVILEPQVEFTAAQIRSLKEFFEDFFDAPPHSSEAKALSQETSVKLEERIHELNALVAQTDQYPFLNVLTPVIEKLAEVVGKPYTWHLTELVDRKDALLDIKENIIEPVRRFMNGSQKDIYKDAYKFLQNQAHNFSYLVGDEQGMPLAAKENAAEEQAATVLFNILNDPQCFRGNRMQQAKTLVENLQKQVTKQIEMEVTKAKETVAALKGRLCGMTEFSVLNDEQQEQITRPFNEFNAAIECQTLIAVIRDTLRRFEESDYQRLLSQMTSWAQPAPTPEPVPQPGQTDIPDDGTKPTPPAKPEPRIEYVPSRSVKISFDKAWLADETDVERYLESMREALLNEIRKGKRIQI